MKHRLLLLIIIIVSTCDCFSQQQTLNCSQFHTGHFAYRDSLSNSIAKFKRTARHQTEKNNNTGLVIKYKVKWLSDCTYKLTQTWASKKEQRKLNYTWRIYHIVAINENTYTYSCDCKDGTKITGVVVKMQE